MGRSREDFSIYIHVDSACLCTSRVNRRCFCASYLQKVTTLSQYWQLLTCESRGPAPVMCMLLI